MGWKAGHNKACRAFLAQELRVKFEAANAADDRSAVIALEGHLEELMAWCGNAYSLLVLQALANAHLEVGDRRKAFSFQERRVVLLGEESLFRDQGHAMSYLGHMLLTARGYAGEGPEGGDDDAALAEEWFQRALKVGQQHGFYQLELESSIGFGRAALRARRNEDALEILRHGSVSSPPAPTTPTSQQNRAMSVLPIW